MNFYNYVMGCKAEELRFNARQGQETFLSSTASRLALELTHPVDTRGSFPGVKAACT
jgi:hypothetical protein